MAKSIKVAEESKSQLTAMWKHIYSNIRDMLHPHHFTHEPGGLDEVKFPLGYVKNITITDPEVGQALVISEVGDNGDWWANGASVGGGKSQVHFSVMLPATIVPPGPTNITGTAYKVNSVLSTTDDSNVAATLSAGTLSIAIPCSRTNYATGSEPIWGDGETMTLSFSDAGFDGTYIAVDVAVS